MPEPSLPDLVIKAQRGDRAAFERIVHATARLVYAQIVLAVRDRQKAEDLTQETFLAAWKALATVVQPAGFTTWLLTLARNVTLDAIKFDGRKKRQGSEGPPAAGEAAAGLSDDALAPAQAAEQAEARDFALQLLEELPEEYRRPLALRYLAGADYLAIRQQLGLSDGALRGLLTRGMALLRERMTRSTDPVSRK